MLQFFRGSIIVTVLGVLAAGIFGYLKAGTLGAVAGVVTAILLGCLEVALSFDNAVVNAKVLENMSEIWRQRFITWGMLIAVFGMRFIFPILIVSVMAHVGIMDVVHMALANPDEYAKKLTEAHVAINMFGATFLGMVFLKWLMDEAKDLHWIALVEAPLARLGKLDMVQVILMGTAALVVPSFLPAHDQLTAVIAGVSGVLLYTTIDSLSALFEAPEAGAAVAKGGLMSFIYLEILDASFSFDGVIGAFAITNNVLIIMVGLAIGAMFVRSLTIMLVRKGTLAEYRYLEHGAHWGIGSLAAMMLFGLFAHIPEVITGLFGIGFIVASLMSSLAANKLEAA